jgi:hypothetical protein
MAKVGNGDPVAFMSHWATGTVSPEPPPKPVTAKPVARPGLSGNHWGSVWRGTM